MNKALFDYIAACPTPYHAAAHTGRLLEQAGYIRLSEGGRWQLETGNGYYVTRNGSSLLAFRLPEREFSGYMIAAAHCDSPCLKIRENAALRDGAYVRLSTEKYGGMLCASWLDRPLSVAGRVMVRTADGTAVRLVDLGDPAALIPSVAIHMNRKANDGMAYNPAVDMLPLYSADRACDFRARIAEAAGISGQEILASDLFVYNPQPGVQWDAFISAPRLDDLQCAFAALTAFLQAQPGGSVPVLCLFDNEEVGSQTKQGAASTFLADTLVRIGSCCGLDGAEHRRRIANSFLVSCDNAHAVHPNHPEYADKNHAPQMNGGVVLKYNAAQRYTTDAASAALLRLICREAQVPVQEYANRADLPGGSTLGNISNTQVSLNAADVGLAQLAMHSAFETAGSADTQYLARALEVFYGKTLQMNDDGGCRLF